MRLICFRSSTALSILLIASVPGWAIPAVPPQAPLHPPLTRYRPPSVTATLAFFSQEDFIASDGVPEALLIASTEPAELYAAGVALWQQGQLLAALAKFEAVLAHYQATGDQQGEAQARQALGIVNHDLGRYAPALEHLERSLSLFRSGGDRTGAADALNGLGLVHRSQGNYVAAADYFQQALTLHREVGNRSGEATTLHNLADVRLSQGDYSTATAYGQQALALNQQLGDERNRVRNFNLLATIAAYQGNYARATQLFDEVLQKNAALGDVALQSTLLSNMGFVFGSQGRYPEALNYHQQALALAREAGSRNAEATALNNLGLVDYWLGQYGRAQAHFEQALAIARQIGDRPGEAVALSNLASVYDENGNQQEAITLWQTALTLQRALGNRPGETEVLNNLGTVYDDLGDYAAALQHYTAARTLSQTLGYRYVEGRILSNIGVTYLHQQQYDLARNYLERAIAVFDETDDAVAKANALRRLAEIQYHSGQLAAAAALSAQTINHLASLRSANLTDAERVALLDTQRSAYMTYQQILIAQGDITAALEVSEQGRARAFAERLVAHTDRPLGAEPLAAPTIDEIRAVARSQPATLVEYALIQPNPQDEPQLYIWVIQPSGEVFFRAQTLQSQAGTRGQTPNTLTSLVAGFRYDVGAGSRGLGVVAAHAGPTSNSYQGLYEQLISPIADLLPQDPNALVVFIPQDELFQVPFAALQRPDQSYLIEHHTLLTAPSIQILGLTQATALSGDAPQLERALVVGNPAMPSVWTPQQRSWEPLPSLPGAEQEAVAIANLLATQPLLGSAATEQQVKQALPGAQVIHLATHGLLEYGNVADSGIRDLPGAIALTAGGNEDGLLTAAELLEIPLSADLVVLSACDTGRGKITGDGVMGLSRSLMTSGVPSVVVSLWSVPDAPTAVLMTEFYRQLTQGRSKAQALRQAMLLTLAENPHPRDWAAFTLVGNPQ